MSAAGVPADAVAVVVNLTATETGVGYWTAFRSAKRARPPATSTSIKPVRRAPGKRSCCCRARRPSTFSPGRRSPRSSMSPDSSQGPAPPSRPTGSSSRPTHPIARLARFVRHADLGWQHARIPRLRSRPARSPPPPINITGTQSMFAGFVTAFPAGVERPIGVEPQPRHMGSNHRQPRDRPGQQSRDQPVHPAGPAHDRGLNGWYLGTPTQATLAPPINPLYDPNTPAGLRSDDRHVGTGSAPAPTSTRWPISDRGHVERHGGVGHARQHRAVRAPHHARRAVPHHQPDSSRRVVSLLGTDGHLYNYMVVHQDVTIPSFNVINNIGLTSGLSTVQLVACTPPHSVKFRHVTTARLFSVT